MKNHILKKLLYLFLAISILGCNPYSKIIFKPDSWLQFAVDSCDILLLNEMTDSLGYGELDVIFSAKEPCDYLESRKIQFQDDTIESLLTVRPLVLNNDTAMLERIYTITDVNDTAIIIKCRTTEYKTEPNTTPKKYIISTMTLPKEDSSLLNIELGEI